MNSYLEYASIIGIAMFLLVGLPSILFTIDPAIEAVHVVCKNKLEKIETKHYADMLNATAKFIEDKDIVSIQFDPDDDLRDYALIVYRECN